MYARHVSIHNEHDFFLLFFYYEHIELFTSFLIPMDLSQPSSIYIIFKVVKCNYEVCKNNLYSYWKLKTLDPCFVENVARYEFDLEDFPEIFYSTGVFCTM